LSEYFVVGGIPYPPSSAEDPRGISYLYRRLFFL
jgi:hypothetical protein